MKATVKWIDSQRFVGISGSHHAVVMDANSTKSAPSPMEMVLLGLGGCASVDVVSILQKARQQVTSCHVELEAERVDAIPAIFSRIHMNFVVQGHLIKTAQVERAVALSAEKYCSVGVMLGKAGVKITHSFTITENASTEAAN